MIQLNMNETEPQNLMDGLLSEMNRCRELQKEYEAIGTPGLFGLAMLKNEVKTAENAIKENDVIKMLSAYKALKQCQ